MKSQDEKIRLIEYLFDEMTEEERIAIESRLQEDNELREELTGLTEVREFLQLADNPQRDVDMRRKTIIRSSPLRLIL